MIGKGFGDDGMVIYGYFGVRKGKGGGFNLYTTYLSMEKGLQKGN